MVERVYSSNPKQSFRNSFHKLPLIIVQEIVSIANITKALMNQKVQILLLEALVVYFHCFHIKLV